MPFRVPHATVHRILVAMAAAALLLAAWPAVGAIAGAAPSAARAGDATTARPDARAATRPPSAHGARNGIYAYYYLWWTHRHWADKLGRRYPYRRRSLPTPGSMDSRICSPRVRYSGSEIVDIPREGLYSQNVSRTFDRHIAEAAKAGLRGFVLSWQGTGRARQSPASSGFDRRLDRMVSRVSRYNRSHHAHFRLALAYEAFERFSRPASRVINDLRYFSRRYGSKLVFRNSFSSKPMVMLLDSRKLRPAVGSPGAVLPRVFAAVGSSLYLIGDETYRSYAADAPYLHASSYYWSSQNPWTNPAAQWQIASLGGQIHRDRKRWFAPVIAGFNKQLVGGQSCVPRIGLETLRRVWAMNKTSRPDAWFAISWNEFVENTYLQPSANYGSRYLRELGRLAFQG